MNVVKNMSLTTVKNSHLPSSSKSMSIAVTINGKHIISTTVFTWEKNERRKQVRNRGQYSEPIYPRGVEDSGSALTVAPFCLLLLGSDPDAFLSEAPPPAFMEFKIPGPLIPVLEPSSAADWEIFEGLTLASRNLLESAGGTKGTKWPPRGGYCTAEPMFMGIGRSNLGGWNMREAEVCLICCCEPKAESSSFDLLSLSPPDPFLSNCIHAKGTLSRKNLAT